MAFGSGCPALTNDQELCGCIQTYTEELLGQDKAFSGLQKPSKASSSEDFAYVREKAPGVFVRLGARSEGGPYCGLHSPSFYCDRKALTTGILTLAGIALDFFGAEY